MTHRKRKLPGRLTIISYILKGLERAIKLSFAARRGPLYDALNALIAFVLLEMVALAMVERPNRRCSIRMMSDALNRQLDTNINQQFKFAKTARRAYRKYKNLDILLDRLEILIPACMAEYEARVAADSLVPRTGPKDWFKGQHEVGSIEDLVKFTAQALDFTSLNLDEPDMRSSRRRVEKLEYLLPSK